LFNGPLPAPLYDKKRWRVAELTFDKLPMSGPPLPQGLPRRNNGQSSSELIRDRHPKDCVIRFACREETI
jgi:hypothetical protein